MKFKMLILVLMLMVCSISVLGQVENIAGSIVDVQLLRHEPLPAYPGEILEVWVKVENTGGSPARDVKIEFQDNYPFMLETGERKLHEIGTLSGGQSYVAKFRVRVDKDAPAGTSYINIRYTDSGVSIWRENLLSIDIESRFTTLAIDSITTDPARIAPGQKGEIIISLRNIAGNSIRDLTAKLDLENSDAPLVPVESATELKLNSLAPGESHEFRFNVLAEMDAATNAYTIPLNLTFKNERGSTISNDDLVGVQIGSEPDLVVTVDSTDVYADNTRGKITLQFINKGTDDLKFVYVNLLPSDSYKLLSPTDRYYIGNIDSDDYEIQEIQLNAQEDVLEIPMEIEYRDAFNNRHVTSETLTINLINRSEIEQEESSTGTWIIVLLVLSGLIFYFWRRRKRKRK